MRFLRLLERKLGEIPQRDATGEKRKFIEKKAEMLEWTNGMGSDFCKNKR